MRLSLLAVSFLVIFTNSAAQEGNCSIYRIGNGGFSERVEMREFHWTLTYRRWVEYPKLPLGGTKLPGSSVYVSCDKNYAFQGKRGNLVQVTCSKGKWNPYPACLYPGTPFTKEANISTENAENTYLRPRSTRQPLILTTQSRPSEPDEILDHNQKQEPTPYSSCGCTYRSDDDTVVTLVGTEQLKDGSTVQNNEKIKFHCRLFGYSRLDGVPEITCENCRSWHSSEFPQCVSPRTGDTILQFEGDYTILPGGIVGVAKNKQLSIRCYPNAIEGFPMWSTSITEELLFSSYVDQIGRSVSMLNISNAAPHHNGQYLCFMKDYRPTALEIQVISPPSLNCPKFDEKDFVIYYDNGQAVNSTAMFTCKDHHKRIEGPNTVNCLANGQWSGNPPKCKTACPLIVETEGLSVSYSKGLYEGSVAGFHCLMPRTRSGVPRTTCRANGEWANPPAKCISGTPFTEEANISTENAENSYLRPRSTRRPLILTTQSRPSEPDEILDHNQKQGPTPYPSCGCTYRSDDDTVVALVGTEQLKDGSTVQNNEKIKFHCRHFGYSRLKGVPEIMCENCRSWHLFEFPQCVSPQTGDTILQFEGDYTILPGGIVGVAKNKPLSIRCYPSTIEVPVWSTSITEQLLFSNHSGRSVSMLNISNAAPHHNGQYRCSMKGYRPTAFEIQVISPTSLNCPKLDEKDFVIYYENGQSLNSTAVFTCKDHRKRIDGPNTVNCLANGKWSGNPPKCKTACPLIVETEGLSVSYTKGLVEGSVAGFHCLAPRTLTGVPRTTCRANGEWANPPAKCILQSCSLEKIFNVLPENVVPVLDGITSDTLPYNFTLQLTCNNNMALSGSNVAKCRQDGTWQVSKVQCVAGCSLLRAKNSELIIEPDKSFYRLGELVSLSCPHGYALSSEVVRLICLGTSWSETVLPECVRQ